MTPAPDGTESTETTEGTENIEGTGGDGTQTEETTEESTGTEGPAPDEGTGAKYTDKDLDHHKGKARNEGRSSALKALGFDKLEDAQAWVNERRTGEEKATEEESRADKVLATANRRIVLSDARDVAKDLGVKPSRINNVIKDFVDLDGVEVDEDGEADRDTIKERISEFTTKYPEFLKSSTGKNPGERETPPAPTGVDAEIEDAMKQGNFVLAERLRAQKLAATK